MEERFESLPDLLREIRKRQSKLQSKNNVLDPLPPHQSKSGQQKKKKKKKSLFFFIISTPVLANSSGMIISCLKINTEEKEEEEEAKKKHIQNRKEFPKHDDANKQTNKQRINDCL
jgi:hypothetical protein